MERTIASKYEQKIHLIEKALTDLDKQNVKLKNEEGPGRNFLLLGEKHSHTPDCDKDVGDLDCFNHWIKYVTRNSPYCLDFFLEGISKVGMYSHLLKPVDVKIYKGGADVMGQAPKDKRDYVGVLDHTRNLFRRNDISVLKNTRFHSVEIRQVDKINGEHINSIFNIGTKYIDEEDNFSKIISTLVKNGKEKSLKYPHSTK